MPKSLVLLLFLTTLGCHAIHKAQERVSVPLSLEAIDSLRARAIFGDSLHTEVLFSGKGWLESPLVLPNGDVICSDVENNHLLRWTGSGSEVYLERSGSVDNNYSREPGSNGIALDQQGRLLLCQHGARRVVRLDSDPADTVAVFTVLADNYGGKRFNSPNDLFVAGDGSILFTDPPYGLPEGDDGEMGFYGVYRIDPSGRVNLITRALRRPNGLALDAAEENIYIAQSDGEYPVIVSFPYRADKEHKGLMTKVLDSADFGDDRPGSPDGFELTENGLLYASIPGGMCIFDLETLSVIAKVRSDRPISNLTISPDKRWLYLTNDDRLVRVKLNEI